MIEWPSRSDGAAILDVAIMAGMGLVLGISVALLFEGTVALPGIGDVPGTVVGAIGVIGSLGAYRTFGVCGDCGSKMCFSGACDCGEPADGRTVRE